MANTLPSINLIRKDRESFFDKFLKWALSIGRLIVILTEIIALSAFLYRFSLDRQLIDLHDQIKQKQAILGFLKPSEDKYRNIQNRIALAASLGNAASNTTTTLYDVINSAPNDFVFNTIIITSEGVRIDANAQSVTSLTAFIKSLKNYPKVQSVSLDKIENKTSSATIAVNISAQFKKGK